MLITFLQKFVCTVSLKCPQAGSKISFTSSRHQIHLTTEVSYTYSFIYLLLCKISNLYTSKFIQQGVHYSVANYSGSFGTYAII